MVGVPGGGRSRIPQALPGRLEGYAKPGGGRGGSSFRPRISNPPPRGPPTRHREGVAHLGAALAAVKARWSPRRPRRPSCSAPPEPPRPADGARRAPLSATGRSAPRRRARPRSHSAPTLRPAAWRPGHLAPGASGARREAPPELPRSAFRSVARRPDRSAPGCPESRAPPGGSAPRRAWRLRARRPGRLAPRPLRARRLRRSARGSAPPLRAETPTEPPPGRPPGASPNRPGSSGS